MSHIRKLTEGYAEAFNAKDLDRISNLMDPGFRLTDPSVVDLSPRSDVLAYIEGIFDGAGEGFHFTATNIFIDGNISVIEFKLKVQGETHIGTDIIEWDNHKMLSMRAYLYPIEEA